MSAELPLYYDLFFYREESFAFFENRTNKKIVFSEEFKNMLDSGSDFFVSFVLEK